MAKLNLHRATAVVRRLETLCWREYLGAALSGVYPSEAQLEKMLDRLERMP
ncbi:MAG: hypothetical protein AAGA28_00775 [Pseudomonadota bacterium]